MRHAIATHTAVIRRILVELRYVGVSSGSIITAAPEAEFVRTCNLDVKGAIKVRDLAFRYGAADQHVLRDIGLDVAAGDFVAIMGPSGAGKTTLLKLLLGLYHPTSGTIQLDDHLTDPELWLAWRARVGIVAQDD
jgi:ABC-type bacteriocin/lantibiotic exporter with double-glycine peptidase domain